MVDVIECLAPVLIEEKVQSRVFIDSAEGDMLVNITIEGYNGFLFSFVLPPVSAILHPILVLLMWLTAFLSICD